MVTVVDARGLTKRFGDALAVDALDLRVRAGEAFGLLGGNGAGKTTTLRMLTGVLPPTAGSARVAGVDVRRDASALGARVGVVFGENVTPEPAMSPVRYLRHFARLHALPRDVADARARELFDVLDLLPHAERPIRALSGGNRRKVEIARALLHAPDVLFLDEPTRELDIPTKRSVWRFLKRLTAEHGLTVILSSHDAHEIASLCTRLGVLHAGRLAWEGPPRALASAGTDLADALARVLEHADARPGS